MSDSRKEERLKAADAAERHAFPNPEGVDRRVLNRTEEEIEKVIDDLLRPYLMEVIPALMRKLNHQGHFDKIVKARLEESLKDSLATYFEGVKDDIIEKIDRKFREVILEEFEPRIEQAAKKLLDERLAKLRAEFSK